MFGTRIQGISSGDIPLHKTTLLAATRDFKELKEYAARVEKLIGIVANCYMHIRLPDIPTSGKLEDLVPKYAELIKGVEDNLLKRCIAAAFPVVYYQNEIAVQIGNEEKFIVGQTTIPPRGASRWHLKCAKILEDLGCRVGYMRLSDKHGMNEHNVQIATYQGKTFCTSEPFGDSRIRSEIASWGFKQWGCILFFGTTLITATMVLMESVGAVVATLSLSTIVWFPFFCEYMNDDLYPRVHVKLDQ